MMQSMTVLLSAVVFCLTTVAVANPLELHVSVKGNDKWSGTVASPFATLERARDEIRARKRSGKLPDGAVVEISAGIYELKQPLTLSEEDSGTNGKPIVYRAKRGQQVRLVGGKVVTGWKPVTDAGILNRLGPAARPHVLQADLHAQGLTDLPSIKAGMGWSQSQPGLEFFFNDKPMTLARWPNEGFTKIKDTLNIEPYDIRGTWGDKAGKFVYEGDRPKRWVGEPEIWLHGYWFWDWADERERVESIDTNKSVITLAKPYHSFGYRKGQWYYAFNLLCELDSPGEWYLDREKGILYFWPPSPISASKAMVSVLPSLITMNGASNVVFHGITLECARGRAVVADGGANNEFVACTVRNVGSWGISISDSPGSGVEGCDIYYTGDGGVSIQGGDRRTLVPAKMFVDNCHIHHYSRWNPVYKPGVMMNGVGNRISHNLINNAPHMAIGFGGNDHVIEFNEIHSVCYESNDAGAMYAGRNWTMRGTVIRNNYLHHVNGFEGRGCVGVYLDDQYSGTSVVGNVFWKVTRAAMIGGGRDCTIENNIFVDCVPSTHVDARGLGWAASGFDGLKQDLESMPYKDSVWAAKYPQLTSILDDDPMAPKGNIIARNISIGGRWGDFEPKAKQLTTFTDNLIDVDPHFVDSKHGNFRLKPDSPAWKIGFKAIPIDQIGPYKSEDRASWPVHSDVRPMAIPPNETSRASNPSASKNIVVNKSAVHVKADGLLSDSEWPNLDSVSRTLVLEQGVHGEKLTPPSKVWLSQDGECLYVAFNNPVNTAKPIQTGSVWGKNDAVEIAVKDLSKGSKGPILLLRGYVNGHFESTDEAGASPDAVHSVISGVQYAAKTSSDGWCCEWRIPLKSLEMSPNRKHKLAMNLSVRKTADDQWMMWRGTEGYTWEVDRANTVEIAP